SPAYTGCPRAVITSPSPESALSSSSVTFQWSAGTGAGRYQLSISRSQGGADIYNQDRASNVSATVNGLPSNGGTLWVRLWTLISGAWQFNDYSYTACSISCGSSAAAALTSPTPGNALTSSTVNFQWTAGTGAARYQLSISRYPGQAEVYNQDQGTAQSVTVNGLPIN